MKQAAPVLNTNPKTNLDNCAKLAIAAQALLTQLDMMMNHPSYKGIFEVAAIGHNIIYNGPTCGNELEALRLQLHKYFQATGEVPKIQKQSFIR